ncbi:hypothetical protein [uncultured Clostridium sp.]|uniref:hypothetical protein n=1 Tax=uncultured Clostridium sp. TaxID=59620 RepID=UPI0025F95FCB|nr:hypothetical protein [uncultured Clostridium sp.]
MKIIDFSMDEYNFKEAMKQNIKENIQPLLLENRFKKYSTNKYIRESNGLLQIITFRIGKDNLRAYASYIPLFVPLDNVLDYGIEITGSSGVNLLNGEFYTTIYEREKLDTKIQLKNYYQEHLTELKKLFVTIKMGVIPEMDEIDSFECFANRLKSDNVTFFGAKYNDAFKNGVLYEFIMGVFKCISCDFKQGIKELVRLNEWLQNYAISSDLEIKLCLEKLLSFDTSRVNITENEFLDNYADICNKRRKKYKLIK